MNPFCKQKKIQISEQFQQPSSIKHNTTASISPFLNSGLPSRPLECRKRHDAAIPEVESQCLGSCGSTAYTPPLMGTITQRLSSLQLHRLYVVARDRQAFPLTPGPQNSDERFHRLQVYIVPDIGPTNEWDCWYFAPTTLPLHMHTHTSTHLRAFYKHVAMA